jgi:hypothetical protein
VFVPFPTAIPINQAVGVYYAPAAYNLYEAESKVTVAEKSLRVAETKASGFETDIARAKNAVARGAVEFAKARADAVSAVEATTAARQTQEAATRALENALALEAKSTARVSAIQEETKRNELELVWKTREKENSGAERVRLELAVGKARAHAVKAAEAISLPPMVKW